MINNKHHSFFNILLRLFSKMKVNNCLFIILVLRVSLLTNINLKIIKFIMFNMVISYALIIIILLEYYLP